jgi:hypothetical protein
MPHNETHLSTWQWWSKRRLRYNLALMAAGFTAFVLMNIIESSFEEQFPEYELTAFTPWHCPSWFRPSRSRSRSASR